MCIRDSYYRLVPVFENDLPPEKEELDVDKDILNNHEINIFDSVYDGKYDIRVGVGSTNTFSYTVADNPEKVSYGGTTSTISYITNASGAIGAVNSFEVTDGGGNYYSIPGVSTVTSADGKYCIAEASSQSIGKITKTEIRNMGFNFPSDPTLEPSVALPLIVSIKEFARVEHVGILSAGRGYSSPPNLRIFDGKTEKYHDEFRAKYDLKAQKVTILENVTGIHNVTPYIIPTENTNGVGISTVGFNSTTKDVTLTLSVGFTTAGSFPFALGDKIIVENVSVGLGSTGTGYNSADYNFKLFTVNAVDENIGGIGTIAYSLLDQLDDGETPGVYDGPSSAGRVVPQKHFPIFNISVKPADYFQGEEVTSTNQFDEPISGTVDRWDRNCLLYTSPSPRDATLSRMPASA